MSLRSRLTLLYSTVLGGVFTLVGALVYALVSVFLLNQVNNTLIISAEELIAQLQINASNQFDVRSITQYLPPDNISYQVWGNNRTLQLSYPQSADNQPLDENGLWAGTQIIENIQFQDHRIRVFSIPLKTERGPVGTLQVGFNLTLIDIARQTLATVLILIFSFAVILTSLLTYLLSDRALAPLSTVTQIATNITRADDLQRRIPLTGSSDDEVGQLIVAFNETLERLELLFNTQRRFLADVSHELRTPLTVIKGNIGLIRKFGVDEESLSSIETEVDRLTRLVGDLLLLAQAETGQLPLNKSRIALDTLMLDVFQQMRTLAGEKVKLHIAEIDQVQINADEDRMKQVLVNLISNAIYYTPQNGNVTISLSKKEGKALFVVQDNGPGIDEKDLPHIFERFYRGEKSRSRTKGKGFGLGLSIAYWIVTNHDGEIEVQTKPGKGTTFKVWLPLAE